MGIQFSTEDLKTTDRLERVLRQFEDAINAPAPQSSSLSAAQLTQAANALAPLIRNALQATGSAPLNLQSLLPSGTSAGATVIEDTHANRLTLYSGGSIPAQGTLFVETDRNVLYVVKTVSSALKWVWLAGVNIATSISLPNDLGSNDAGFTSLATDTLTQYTWTGSAWDTTGGLYQTLTNSSSAANTDIFIIQHLLNNIAGAANMAAGILAQLVNDAKATVDGSRITTVITDPAAATFTTKLRVELRSSGAALADWFDVLVTGIQFKVGSNFGVFTHANTGTRTYTFADSNGNIVYETAALTNGNFVFGGGGALVQDSGFAVVPAGSGGTGITYNRIADSRAFTNQSADIGSINFTNVVTGANNMYRVSWSLQDTAADITAGTVTLTISYTDDAGAATFTATQVLTGTGRSSGSGFIEAASGNISFATSHTGIFGTAKYALYLVLERLT